MHRKGAVAAGLAFACSLSASAAEFKVSDDVTFSAGLGLRASYSRRDFGAPDGTSKSNDFSVESARLYLGGSYANVDPYPASIWRCEVRKSGNNYRVASSASIGTHAHADVHSLVHTPGDPNELWCTCDGGVPLRPW